MTSFLLSSLLVHFCLHSSLSSSATQLQPIHHATGTCFVAAFPFPHPQDLCLNLHRLLKTPSCLQEASDLQQSSAPCRKGCGGMRKVRGKLRLALRVDLQTLLHTGSTLQASQKPGDPAAAARLVPKGGPGLCDPLLWPLGCGPAAFGRLWIRPGDLPRAALLWSP